MEFVPNTTEDIRAEGELVHVTIISKTSKFSNENIHIPDEKRNTEYIGNDDLLKYQYFLEVYANGSCEENVGYVSVAISHVQEGKAIEGTCLISVIDASGNHRISRTFTLLGVPNPTFQSDKLSIVRIDKYIARETLLKDADLLPDDILTLHIDIYFENPVENSFLNYYDIRYTIQSSFENRQTAEGYPMYYFRLDSLLVKRLAKESKYFQSMLDAPMLERNTRRMPLCIAEYLIFQYIGSLLLGLNPLVYNSLKEIFSMYIIADKYDIPIVADTCLCFLKLCLSDHNAEELLVIADGYNNEYLTERLKNQILLMSGKSNAGETRAKKKRIVPKQRVGSCEWIYKHDSTNPYSPLCFERETKTKTIAYVEDNAFDFYK